MQVFYETHLNLEQGKVPFLPKDFEPESSWLNQFIDENFDESKRDALFKQMNFLVHHKTYGEYIKKCLCRVHLLEDPKLKKYMIEQISDVFYLRPWVVSTQLLRILARPSFENSFTKHLYLIRESMINEVATKYANNQLHQYLRFYDQAYKMNFGVLPLINDKYLIVAQRELSDKKIQELIAHDVEIYHDGPSTLFLLLKMEPDLTQMKLFFHDSIKNVGSEFILLSVFKILNLIPLNQNEATFISNNIVLRKYIANLIELIIHAEQLDNQACFVIFFWQTACYKHAIFDYLSVEHTSLFLRWLLTRNLIDKTFSINESPLLQWAIENGDSSLFFSVFEQSDKFNDTEKISALFSGNLDICKVVFKNSSISQLQYFLGQAIKSNHLHIVQWFFELGVEPKLQTNALYALAKNENLLMIEEFLKQGAVIQPYMISTLINTHDQGLLAYLLTHHGDKILKLDFKGMDLASYLIHKKNVEFLELLLAHQINFEIKSFDDIETLSIKAIKDNCHLLSRYLMSLREPEPQLFDIAKDYHHIDLLKMMITQYNLSALVPNKKEFLNWVAINGFHSLIDPIIKNNPELLEASSMPLVLAARKGRVNVVNRLLKYGADVNFTDETGETALTWSSYEGYARIVKHLVEHKNIDINHKNHAGLSALNNSVLQKRCKIANMLLQSGAKYNRKIFDELLNLACIKNNIMLLETLTGLKKGRLKISMDHIWLAIKHNSKAILEILLSKYKSISHACMLVYAIDIGKLGVIKLLYANGADLNHVYPDGKTPLILALQGCQPRIIDFLLENDVDVDVSWQNKFAIEFAIDKKNIKAIVKIINNSSRPIESLNSVINKISSIAERHSVYRALIKKGFDTQLIPSHDIPDLLDIIIKKDDEAALQLLIRDMELNATSLQLSTRYQSKKCFEILNKSLNWQDSQSCSPLIWAIRNQNPQMVSKLTHQLQCTYLGNSPIEFASYLKNFEILKIIYQKQSSKLNNQQLPQIILGLLRASHDKKLNDEDNLFLKKVLVEIPTITDIWGNSVLDYFDAPEVEIKVISKATDLSVFKSHVLERCFKHLMANYPKQLALMQKISLQNPDLLILMEYEKNLFDKKQFKEIEFLFKQLEGQLNFDYSNTKELIQVLHQIKDLKQKYAVGGAFIDLNVFKIELSRYLKLKKLDAFIESVLAGLSQQGLITSFIFGISEHIKEIKYVYNNLTPEERLSFFDNTAIFEDSSNRLLQALSFKQFQMFKQTKIVGDFKKLIQSQRASER